MKKNNTLLLINEIIQKQSVILGPQIAVLKAKSVPGITVDSNGKVTDVSGIPS
jgi:hypothetical protein